MVIEYLKPSRLKFKHTEISPAFWEAILQSFEDYKTFYRMRKKGTF